MIETIQLIMRKINISGWFLFPVIMVLLIAPVIFSAGSAEQATSGSRKVKTHEIWMTDFAKKGVVNWKDEVKVYDRNGKVLKYTNFTKDGSIRRSYEQEFDKNGKRISRKEFEVVKERDEKSTYSHTQWKYNAHGRKTEELEFSKEGTLKRRSVMTYNASGQKIKEMTWDKEGGLKKQQIYTYSKDKLEDTRISLDGAGDTLSIRKNRYEFY